MTYVAVSVPHAGEGSHTLTVALEVDDRLLADAEGRRTAISRIGDLAQQAMNEHVTQMVLGEVADAHKIAAADILGDSRNRDVVAARQHVMALLLDAGLSTKQVGRRVNRDHSTVIAGARAHRRRVEDGTANVEASGICERCDRRSLGGGRWCDRHFRDVVAARKGAA